MIAHGDIGACWLARHINRHGAGECTLMTLTVTYASHGAREGAIKSGMMDGMEAGYVRLDDVLAG